MAEDEDDHDEKIRLIQNEMNGDFNEECEQRGEHAGAAAGKSGKVWRDRPTC